MCSRTAVGEGEVGRSSPKIFGRGNSQLVDAAESSCSESEVLHMIKSITNLTEVLESTIISRGLPSSKGCVYSGFESFCCHLSRVFQRYVHPVFYDLGCLAGQSSPGSRSCSEQVDHLASQNHLE